MEGRYLQTIMTYQYAAMAGAIAQIFSNSQHRLCIWHIEENSKKNIKSLRSQKEFIDLFNYVLKYSDTETEFQFYWSRYIMNLIVLFCESEL